MIERTVNVSVAILINKRNESLLQKKDIGYPWAPGKWCFFGGGIENGEDPKTALIRELTEEIGYEPRQIELFREDTFRDECHLGIKRGKRYSYECIFEGEISDISLREGAGFGFFSADELDSIPLIGHDLTLLREDFQRKK